jgi:hypothetical protein
MASASPAALALGYGSGSASSLYSGSSIADQMANETEEERKKRLAMLAQQQRPGNLGQGYGSAIGGTVSAAGSALGLGG